MLVLARITALALLGLMSDTTQIHARGEHAAKFDLIVCLHDTNYARVFIKSKSIF